MEDDERGASAATSGAPPSPAATGRAVDTGLAALGVVARFHGVAIDPGKLRHEYGSQDEAFSEAQLIAAATSLGLKVRPLDTRFDRLPTTPLPALAVGTDGSWVVLAQADAERVLVQDPTQGVPRILPRAEFEARWSGRLLLIASRASLVAELARFDFTWFVPAIVKHRKLLGEVLAVSFVLNLLALATPIFFQVVMDKVLVHQGYSTLDVIAIGFLAVVLFETVLGGLRTYVFAHTTSRIDAELGGRLYRHLIALPIAYFEARRVGDSVARVRELENIRNFLTSSAVTLVIDVLFSVVFIAVMLFYSPVLTLVVLATLPLYVVVIASIMPALRQRLEEKFNRGAENQALLVESISGVATIKSLAAEPQMTRRWDQVLAAYVAAAFRVVKLHTVGSQAIGLINKLATVAILWFGARLVIEGELTVGMLVAFNMLAARVAMPVMHIAQLWQDFQQTGISIRRLGDILNARSEVNPSAASLPPIKGRIELDRVSLRYRPDAPEALREVSIAIEPGEVIGIVGPSGSGKSSLAKLVQRLYVPERGRVLIDGIDLALADPAWLRRQIGVVPQENLLFHRSVRENIALTDPGAPLEAVMRAAKLAGAHDFIAELPNGYDTLVGEHGATLSGGQRQRVAIARALLTNPRILIFDEATSALDYESERAIQSNMRAICQGRTVIVIAHRLTALNGVNRLIVLDKGQVVETGTPVELAARDSYFARLRKLQAA